MKPSKVRKRSRKAPPNSWADGETTTGLLFALLAVAATIAIFVLGIPFL